MAILSFEQLFFILLTISFVIFFGIYKSRAVASATTYSLAGRKATASMVAGTIAGTVVGGGATVGTAQTASIIGLSAWWFTLGAGISLIIMGCFYATKLRQTGLETISEYLVLNYGKSVGFLMSILSSLGIFFGIVASFLPGIGIVAFLFHLPLWLATVVLIFFIALYVFIGGIKSAAIGGILKMIILWFSMFCAGVFALYQLHTLPNLSAILPAYPWYSLFGGGVSKGLSNLFSMIVGIISTQTYIQALFSAKSPQTAMIGSFVAALIVIPIGLPSVAIGMYMHIFSPDTPHLLVLPMYLLTVMPPWLGGIAVGGIMLSIIGSIAGLSLGVGTMITKDLLASVMHKTDEKIFLQVNRFCVCLVIFAAALVAIFYIHSEILFWNYLSMALRGAGVFLPLTIALIRPHLIEPKWVDISMIGSTGIALVTSFYSFAVSPLLVGLGISAFFLGVGYVVKKRAIHKA